MEFTAGSLPIKTLLNQIVTKSDKKLDLTPSYQRGFVWDKKFQESLILSLFKNYPIGSVVINVLANTNEKGFISEVVDGQQRLTTILDFFDNKIVLSKKISYEIIKYNEKIFKNESPKIYKKFCDSKNVCLKYSLFPETLKENFESYPVAIIRMTNASSESVREYFKYVQNQEKLKAGELINAIPDSQLSVYLDLIENYKEKFLLNIGFKDSRKEFDKLFYSFIGMVNQNINLGCSDHIIKQFVEHIQITDLKIKTTQFIDSSINLIKEISSLNIENPIIFNKRALKFLFLLCATNNDLVKNYGKKEVLLRKIEVLNNVLSAFNSAKHNIVNITLKQSKFFNQDDESDLRSIVLITKGSHLWSRVCELMKVFESKIDKIKI